MDETLAAAFEREHHEIDQGIEAFTLSVSAGTPDVEALRRAIDALRRHIYLEEEFLFPPMRAGGLMAPIFVMIREHGQIWGTLDLLEAAVEDDAASTNAAQACAELVTRLDAHNSKEEPIIYPQADSVLSDFEKERLAMMLDRGRTPDGWVCKAASG